MAKQTTQPKHPYVPRGDLVSDRKHWQEVLWNCWNLDKDLYGLLHGIRCGGAELVLTKSSYRIMPSEWSESEWEDIKVNKLMKYRDKLSEAFKLARFGTVTSEKLPDGVFGKGEAKCPNHA